MLLRFTSLDRIWVPGGDGGKLEHGGSLCFDDYFAGPRVIKTTKITAKIANKIIGISAKISTDKQSENK